MAPSWGAVVDSVEFETVVDDPIEVPVAVLVGALDGVVISTAVPTLTLLDVDVQAASTLTATTIGPMNARRVD